MYVSFVLKKEEKKTYFSFFGIFQGEFFERKKNFYFFI